MTTSLAISVHVSICLLLYKTWERGSSFPRSLSLGSVSPPREKFLQWRKTGTNSRITDITKYSLITSYLGDRGTIFGGDGRAGIILGGEGDAVEFEPDEGVYG